MTQFEKLQNNVIKKIHFLQCRYSKTTANPMAIEEGKDNAAQKLFNKLSRASQANAMQPWQIILTRTTFSEID